MKKMIISWKSTDGLGRVEASFYKETEKSVVEKALQIANEMQADNPSLQLNFALFESTEDPDTWIAAQIHKDSKIKLSGLN